MANDLSRRRLCKALAASPLLTATAAVRPATARPFSFAFMGDIPYNALEEMAVRRIYENFPKDLAFALHIGDIKSGSEECTDSLLKQRFDLLQACPVPLVMLPGDNEWVDCNRRIAGGFDPVERLKMWRRLAARDTRAEKALSLTRHAEWPELVQWRMPLASSTLVGLNIPGTFDGLSETPYAREHQRLRNAANFLWLEQAAAKAEQAHDRFLFVAIHANVHLNKNAPQSQESGKPNNSHYFGFKKALAATMAHYSGQVIVLYGDTHQYRVEHPWENWVGKRLTSVECFGSPFNGSWVRIDVDPAQATPRVTPQVVV